MDTRHSREKKKKKFWPCVFLLLSLLDQTHATLDGTEEGQNTTSPSLSCADNEYKSSNGHCCNKCLPGYKLKKECSGEGQRSQCVKCSPGTYQENTNYFDRCFTCSKCKQIKAVVITSCTHLKNTVCGCQDRFYKKEINHDTWSCIPCKACGEGETQFKECTREKDRECTCKYGHYRVGPSKCVSCTECTPDCQHLCSGSSTPSTPRPIVTLTPDPTLHRILIPVTIFAIILALGVTGYEVFRKWRKGRRGGQPPSSWSESPDQERSIGGQFPQSLNVTNLPVEVDESPLCISHSMTTKQDLVLPDCVPREIKSHEFIYFVLDMVPINRFKELARRLNISEQDIERAERDNRAFIDAQYQMLKVWSDRASGGERSILPQTLVHECLSILKDMNLNGCVESIENKYCTEVQTLM